MSEPISEEVLTLLTVQLNQVTGELLFSSPPRDSVLELFKKLEEQHTGLWSNVDNNKPGIAMMLSLAAQTQFQIQQRAIEHVKETLASVGLDAKVVTSVTDLEKN
jgi:hypothetical protein